MRDYFQSSQQKPGSVFFLNMMTGTSQKQKTGLGLSHHNSQVYPSVHVGGVSETLLNGLFNEILIQSHAPNVFMIASIYI